MTERDDHSSAAADDWRDPVIEAYKKDVDRTLLRENLKLTVEERLLRFERSMRRIAALPESERPTHYEAIDLVDPHDA